jgi:hypothetical protein
MSSSQQYRAKAAQYVALSKKGETPQEVRELEALQRSFSVLADNEEWLEHNAKSMVHAGDPAEAAAAPAVVSEIVAAIDEESLAVDDEHVLRCLGAAVIMQWSHISRKLQRDLFDSASSMADSPDARALRGTIARFLHKHKDDER